MSEGESLAVFVVLMEWVVVALMVSPLLIVLLNLLCGAASTHNQRAAGRMQGHARKTERLRTWRSEPLHPAGRLLCVEKEAGRRAEATRLGRKAKEERNDGFPHHQHYSAGPLPCASKCRKRHFCLCCCVRGQRPTKQSGEFATPLIGKTCLLTQQAYEKCLTWLFFPGIRISQRAKR